MTSDRRRWFHLSLRDFSVALGIAGIGLTAAIWSLKAAGVAPMMFPGDRITHLEQAQRAEDSVNRLLHTPLIDIPNRVTVLEQKVDTLARSADAATREREALLWLSCAMARQQLQALQLPQICGEVRRR